MASLKEIQTCVWFDITNYADVGAVKPRSNNGPVVRKITFNPPLYQVKSLTLVGYEIFQPFPDQNTLPYAGPTTSTLYERDPYFVVSLDGLVVEQSHVLNGVSSQGGVLPINNSGYLTPVSWIQPRGTSSTQDTGVLNEINVRISRPKLSLQTPVDNSNPVAASTQTDMSPLFNRILLKFVVTRFGDQPIQSRDGLPRAQLEQLGDTYYSDDRQIAQRERYNAQRN